MYFCLVGSKGTSIVIAQLAIFALSLNGNELDGASMF